MSELNCWTVPELIARYELEPQLQDVFVEGSFDREVLANALQHVPGQYSFYEIEVVDVPGEVLAKHGLSSGNKQRIIALARELTTLGNNVKFVCLVDKDLDHWFGPLESAGRLRWTMFCSLELHFLTPEIISDILVTTGRIKIQRIEAFVGSLLTVLRELYILRLADRQHTMMMRWLSTRKYLSRDGDIIRFASENYKTALLQTNRCTRRTGEFNAACTSWRERVTGDIRQCSRGHDYLALLAWAMREFNGQREFASEPAIERLLVLISRSISTLSREVL